MPGQEETRGGERPADWRSPQDVVPEELPKGAPPQGKTLLEILGDDAYDDDWIG